MEREAFRQRMQQYKQAKEDDPELKYWDWKSTVQREPLDGIYEDARFMDQIEPRSEPRFELRKGQQYYASPNNLKLMKILGKTINVLGLIGEVVQNLFPSEEAEILEDARYKYENALKPKVYADGGIIDEDPPQNTSERPITNFDPKGDPYNPTYGYNPGAGYVSNSDPLGSQYVEGALLNPVFKLAGNAVSNVARGLTKYSSKYVPEVRRTVQDKINSLFRREAEDKARTYKLYDDAIESRNRIIEDLYSNPAYMGRARQIKKAIRSLPKDMRSIEAAYLQFATPGQYTKWFNKIPLLGTYPIVNKQFQNYEEDKDKAREQR